MYHIQHGEKKKTKEYKSSKHNLMESEGDESPAADIRRMMMTMNRLRKNIGK
jgi:hypothetical protein